MSVEFCLFLCKSVSHICERTCRVKPVWNLCERGLVWLESSMVWWFFFPPQVKHTWFNSPGVGLQTIRDLELCDARVRVVRLPSRLGLANLQDSLYVEYCGWEYGLPENSPPVVRKTEEYHEDFTVGTRDRFLDECTSWECVKLHDYRTSASVNLRWFFSSVASLVSSLSFCLSRELSPFTDCHKPSFSLASSLHFRLCRFCLAAFVPPLPTACQPPAEREQERDRKRGVKAIHRGIK